MKKPLFSILSNSGKNARMISLTKRETFAFCLVTFAAAFLLLFGVWSMVQWSFSCIQEKVMEQKNALLMMKIRNLENQMPNYTKALAAIRCFDDQSRSIYGLSSINKEVRMAGIGGLDDMEMINGAHERLYSQLTVELAVAKQTYREIASKFNQYRHTPFVSPTQGRITSGFGVRLHPVFGTILFHKGMDISNKIGTFVYASGAGIISTVGEDEKSGRFLTIDHGYGHKSTYEHLSLVLVKKGQSVTQAQLVALLGNSGITTGPHLHYGVYSNDKPINPQQIILPDDRNVD
jgi:hypothetical protein